MEPFHYRLSKRTRLFASEEEGELSPELDQGAGAGGRRVPELLFGEVRNGLRETGGQIGMLF